jgi:hypothetical protein
MAFNFFIKLNILSLFWPLLASLTYLAFASFGLFSLFSLFGLKVPFGLYPIWPTWALGCGSPNKYIFQIRT